MTNFWEWYGALNFDVRSYGIARLYLCFIGVQGDFRFWTGAKVIPVLGSQAVIWNCSISRSRNYNSPDGEQCGRE